MTYTVEICNNYEPGELICASWSLGICINSINTYSTFPYLGDTVVFTRWEGGIKVSEASFNGNRYTNYATCEGTFFTYEEVLTKFAESKS